MGNRLTGLVLSQRAFPTTLAVFTLMILSACGGQDPAFTESRTEVDSQSADARAKGKGGPGGEGTISEDQIAEAQRTGAGGSGMDGDGEDGTGNEGTGGEGSGTGADGTDGLAGNDGGGSDSGFGDAGGDGAAADAGDGADGMGDAGGADGGIGGSFRTVQVTQGGEAKVDILWVVDTSGSMAEEQSYLANNFNALITQLNGAGHDFQTAVTTTDICDDQVPSDLALRSCPVDYGGSAATHLRGAFRGDAGRKVLKKGDSDLVAKFNQYTQAGVDASGFEHGLGAAKLAVQKSLNGQNEALVRPDAFLAVIVVSDEEDDGIGLSLTDAYNGHNFVSEGLTTYRFTEDDMISYLQGVKGAGKFSVSTIAPTRLANGTLCSASHSQPLEEGTQYIKAAQKSGGIVQSICDTNWNTSLSNIGRDLSAQITQVVLPSVPDVATITVKVNGSVFAGWTYNAGNNAVKFNAGQVPAEGAQIKVTYYEP